MKFYKFLSSVAAFSLVALSSHAASGLDLIVGFGQSGASNDVTIDFGTVTNYTSTTFLGNYADVLSANFANWNTGTGLSTLQFGAVAANSAPAGLGKSNPTYLTSSWDNSVNGTLGVANSTPWTSLSNAQIAATKTSISNIDNMYGTFTTTGAAVTTLSSDISGWSAMVQPVGTTALQVLSSPQFNTGASELANNGTANYAAADLYSIAYGVGGTGNVTTFLGTLALFQNGDLTFNVAAIPEPSTYAAILGLATLGVVAIRRRKQNLLLA